MLYHGQRLVGKSIGSRPRNYFQTLTCHWKDAERRKTSAVRVKRKRHWKAKNHLWNFVWSFQKKVIFASHCCWRWKVDLFRQSQTQEIMCRPRPTIITTSTQYSWKEGFAVYLVGSEGAVDYELLKPGETVTDDRYRQQLIKLSQALKQKRLE